MANISRREFLKLAPKVAAGVLIPAEIIAHRQEILERLFRQQVVDVEAEGQSFRCVFFLHGAGESVQPDRIDPQALVHDETILEGGAARYLTDLVSPDGQMTRPYGINEVMYGRSAEAQQYLQIVAQKVDQGGSLVINDLATSMLELGVGAAVSGGIAMGSAVGLSHIKNDGLTRRKFLRGLLAGTTAWGITGLIQPAVSTVEAIFPPEAAKTLSSLNAMVDLAHPESLGKTFREAIIAAKTLALTGNANLIFGKAHWTLPFYLESGRENLHRFLELYPKAYLDLRIPDKRYLYTSIRVTKNAQGELVQEEIIHEELRRIFER